MALKLDDFLIKKKEPTQILDLSKVSASSQEELKKIMEKVPEYKIKMDKITPDEVKTLEKKSSSSTKFRNTDVADTKKKAHRIAFNFANPIPGDMRSLRLEDLCSVNIQWRMLTSLRPKTKLDEEYFSKLVELGKLHLHTRHKERNKCSTWYERKSKNKAGITETKIMSCHECGEEFCLNETCRMLGYDAYERYVTLDEKQQHRQLEQQQQRQRQNDIGDSGSSHKNGKKFKRRTPRIRKKYNSKSNRVMFELTLKPSSICRSNLADAARTDIVSIAKRRSSTAATVYANRRTLTIAAMASATIEGRNEKKPN